MRGAPFKEKSLLLEDHMSGSYFKCLSSRVSNVGFN